MRRAERRSRGTWSIGNLTLELLDWESQLWTFRRSGRRSALWTVVRQGTAMRRTSLSAAVLRTAVFLVLAGGCDRSPDRSSVAPSDPTEQPAAKTGTPQPNGDVEPRESPNILVYMVDTLRADDLGCYGSTVTKTPAIDKFASEGTLFVHSNSVAPGTRPSVASFMTGVAPYVHGAESRMQRLPEESDALVRLAEVMKEAGYYTGGIVANPNVASFFGFKKGFDVYEELYQPRLSMSHPTSDDLTSDAPVVVSKIKEFIESAPRDKPYFLFVLSIDPHGPYTPPPPYETMYDEDANGARDGSMAGLRRFAQGLLKGDKSGAERLRALYRGEISYADEHFGKLISWMREGGRLDETLVVFTADHGESFGEHGNRGHGKTVYEDTTHVPMILRYPAGFRMGERREERVDTLDLSATLALAAGGRPPGYWVGRDMRAKLAPRPIFSTMRKRLYDNATVRHNGWKMVVNKRTGVTEYFYLPDDPQERNALAGEKRTRAEARLAGKLKDFYTYAEAMRKQVLSGTIERDLELMPEHLQRTLRSLGYVP